MQFAVFRQEHAGIMEFLRRAQARHIKQIQDLILEVVLIMIWLALSEDLKAWLAKYLSIPLRNLHAEKGN